MVFVPARNEKALPAAGEELARAIVKRELADVCGRGTIVPRFARDALVDSAWVDSAAKNAKLAEAAAACAFCSRRRACEIRSATSKGFTR